MRSENTHLVTRLLENAAQGRDDATDKLLPLVYDELRRMAAAELAREAPGQTLQPTALVHEAYMRLVGSGDAVPWDSRAHFFGAAAIAMRRILVDRARARQSQKRGGKRDRVPLDDNAITTDTRDETILAVDELLQRLDAEDKVKSQLVMLRYFAGLSLEDTAKAMGLTVHKVKAEWAFTRAWMHANLMPEGGETDASL
jgi:RNA polymerase sigma factor (TIGR02999 family)